MSGFRRSTLRAVFPLFATGTGLTIGLAGFLGACGGPAVPASGAGSSSRDVREAGTVAAPIDAATFFVAPDSGVRDAAADRVDASPDAFVAAPSEPTDPMAIHRETRDQLLDLVWDGKGDARTVSFFRTSFNVDGPAHMNQGNKVLARHLISRAQCLEGLKDIVLQTDEQRATCGAENMVPVWSRGKEPAYCIDIFEFPNKACELPIVWSSPSQAQNVCKMQGKRLCTQSEWSLACKADPEGGKDRRYAYGDVLDLQVCNTHQPHRTKCNAAGASTAWATCATDTEPSGAFPKCRSRFGVFDQHGNVAEEMTRKDEKKGIVSQLKGSAWFYLELAKEPDKPVPASTPYKESAHSDHCNFDPRWHVEPIDVAIHVNYHLGFRCCKSI